MDPLLQIIAWCGVACFIGMILFSVIGKYMLAQGNLSPAAAARIRWILFCLSNDTRWLVDQPAKSEMTGPGANAHDRALIQMSTLLAVTAAAKVTGRIISPEDQKRLSEDVMREHESDLAQGIHP